MALLSSPAAPVNMCQTPRPPNMSASGLYPQLSPRDALEGAVKLVEGALQSDSSYSQLVDLFGAYGPIPSTSGLHDHDYPADPLRAAAPATVPSVSMRKIPLPPELTEQVSQAQTLCRLGLFPEIGRAWLTVDSDLFLWLYETGEDLAYFDGLSEAILAVGLVAPRPGVFQRHVSALLCLATCSEIVILGVSLLQEKQQGAAEGELSLLPEPLFTVPSDGVAMTCTGGSWASGRIFFGGRDGCLYEVLYSAGGGWFGRRCRKVNHSSSVLSYLLPAFLTYPFAEEDPLVQLVVDDSRHVLYTRSEKGTLSVYDLGWPHGQGGCSRVISLPLATLSQLAARAAPTVEPDNFASLVHIEALPLSESPQAHLVAVTQAGVRLYLTTSSYASPESRPSTLALLHVRLPPGFSTHAPPQRVRGVRTAYCRRGTTLLVAAHSDERDVLWMLSADAYPFQRCLMEASTLAPLDAGVCCLAAAASRSRAPLPQCQYAVGGGATIPSDPPAVVTEHMEAPRKVVLLSRTSCCVLESPRPVDTLRGLLLDPAAVGGDAVRAFFTLHGEVQASAICLILACNPADVRLAERATQALFVYGGEAKVVAEPPPPPQQQQPSFLGAPSQVWASTPLHGGMAAGGRPSFGSPLQPVQQVGGRAPLFQGSPTAMPPPATAAPEVLFSGRHTGCYLYFSRLVRPLWTLNLVTPVADPTTGAPTDQFVSAVPGQDLANYLQSIVAFRMFLERTSALMAGGAGTMAAAAAAQGGPNMSTRLEPDSLHLRDERLKKAQAEACSRERASLSQLLRLVSLTAELLGLWKVLCDHQFRLVSAAFPPALRDQLRSATLRELLLADRQLPAALAAALVQTYLQDNATTDAVSNRLRSVCPSLYRVEDALFTQAHEKLLAARGERGQRRRMLLDEAIALCKKVGPELPLGTACGLLVGCGHPAGVVDLCLALAQQSDPQGLAVHFYRHGEPPEDERGHRAYAARMDCYRVILQMLAELRAAPVPTSPPPLPAVEGGDQSAGGYEQVLALALQSEDELLHAALYSWLHESGQSARLLDVRSPFLEAHLQRRCCGANASPDQADLLWRYHERVGNFGAAARILARLADRQGPEVTLARRLEYLARAIVCLKGAAPTGGQVAACEGDFLHQLEEKLEVARLQAKVREALLLRRDSSASRAAELAARLDAELVDVTRLYSDYADPCDLAECKLAIVRASGYDKPLLVEGLWRSLLEREFRDSAARAEVLAQRLAMLAREYAPSERFFPLPFLVKFLELRGGQYGFEPGWILEPLLGASVPVGRLREAYSDLYRGKDPVWAGRSLHLLQALARLIRLLVEGEMRQVQGGSADRRRMANRCLDDIPGYLVDLQSMPQEEAGVAQLIREFKALQLRLEQYLQGGH